MRLPGASKAYVPKEKLTGYLLSKTHAVGKAKAKFFRALGFDENNVAELKRELLRIAQTEPITDMVVSPHGTKYIIDGELSTPGGKVVPIRTVWIVEKPQEPPRFVTAYPLE